MSRRVTIGSQLDCTLATLKLNKARAAYEAAETALHEAVAEYTESHLAAYSIAHPTRKVEFMGSMGLTSLIVEARNGKELVSFTGYQGERIGGHQLAEPEFMLEISRQEDETRINGLSQHLGSAIYRNGKKIKG
jgi:hypothetical protein